jgi:hypothetical protein
LSQASVPSASGASVGIAYTALVISRTAGPSSRTLNPLALCSVVTG